MKGRKQAFVVLLDAAGEDDPIKVVRAAQRDVEAGPVVMAWDTGEAFLAASYDTADMLRSRLRRAAPSSRMRLAILPIGYGTTELFGGADLAILRFLRSL